MTYQVKGSADLRPATDAHLQLARRYRSEIADVLVALGLPRPIQAPWFMLHDPIVAALQAEAVFEQTPRARAGLPVRESL